MPPCMLDELKGKVAEAAHAYNENAEEPNKIRRVSLFGSYAKGSARQNSDVDLLVSFTSAVVSLFTLAEVLSSMEEHLETPVDIAQEPVPDDSLLVIEAVIPLYERS
ncbi:nucleotidyltransferase family protein [Eggerthella timonensis]|uniref:nucleotidyltransferase family protein n=1 Tax=Eggerthella timonensis TaxID=1871008 RepID=UPI000C784885|nr:nucleotidyltransferase domain-containing protein [Eggerthella timonensis]